MQAKLLEFSSEPAPNPTLTTKEKSLHATYCIMHCLKYTPLRESVYVCVNDYFKYFTTNFSIENIAIHVQCI